MISLFKQLSICLTVTLTVIQICNHLKEIIKKENKQHIDLNLP